MKKIFLLLLFHLLFYHTYAQISKLEEDKNAVDTLFFSDPETALEISEKNIPLALELNDTNLITYFLDQAGELNRRAGNYEKGIEQMHRCLSFKVNWDDLKDLSLTHNNLGKAYTRKGLYDLAVYHFIEALKLMETDNNLIGQGFYLNNLAAVYDLQHNYTKALEYYDQSLKIKKKLNDSTGMAASFTNLGITYFNLADYKKAYQFHKKAYDIYLKSDNPTKIARTLNNMGETAVKLNDYPLALKNISAANNFMNEINEENLSINITNNLAHIYLRLEAIDSAEKYSELAFKKAADANSFKSLKDIYAVKSKIAQANGDDDAAIKYLNYSIQYNDSLINEANINAVADIQGKYEYEKQLRTISEGELAIAQKEKLIEQEKVKAVFWIGISIFLVIAVLIFFVLYFLKQRNSKLLKGQLALIDSRNKTLNHINEKIKTEMDQVQMTLEEKESLLNNVFSQSKEKELPPELLSLSKREMEVLSYLALGWSDDQLAEKLFVSKSTIKTHLRRIYSKLLVRGRAEAVAIAHKYGLLG